MTGVKEKVVTVSRTIAAPPAFLFSAWTDPRLFAQWFGPKAWTVERCEVDARVGGGWRAWFRRGDGGGVYAGGTYLEIEAPKRLVFTWDLNPERSATESLSVVTVIFTSSGSGSVIEITHRKLGANEAIDMDAGWSNTLDSLAAFFAQRSMTEGDRR